MKHTKERLSGLATGEPDDPATNTRTERNLFSKPGCSYFGLPTMKSTDDSNLKIF
jgi:hypothetical protein